MDCFDNGELCKKTVVKLSAGEINMKERGNDEIVMLNDKKFERYGTYNFFIGF